MSPQLQLLIKQAIQLDRNEQLTLIAHLANSLQSTENHHLGMTLTDLQKLRSEIDIGLEDVQSDRIVDGESVFANLRQKIDRYKETT